VERLQANFGRVNALAYLIEQGSYEELHEITKRQGRQIDRIQARRPRAAVLNRDCGANAWPRSRAYRRELPERCASCSNPRPREAV
jgi:hypothetical protein